VIQKGIRIMIEKMKKFFRNRKKLSLIIITSSLLLIVGGGFVLNHQLTSNQVDAQDTEHVLPEIYEEDNYSTNEEEESYVEQAQELAEEPVASSVVQENVTPTAPTQPASPQNPAPTTPQSPVPPQPLRQRIVISGQTFVYADGGRANGQAIIDANHNMISTWGGTQVLSVNDGLSTHLIGHNPGVFSILFSQHVGSPITVFDSTGASRTYHVTEIARVDDFAMTLTNPPRNYWDRITGVGGREQIVLQTCITDTTNLILFAN